jgi:hypothetical protein
MVNWNGKKTKWSWPISGYYPSISIMAKENSEKTQQKSDSLMSMQCALL